MSRWTETAHDGMLPPLLPTGFYARCTDQVEQSMTEGQTTRGNALGMPELRVSHSDNLPDERPLEPHGGMGVRRTQ